MLAAWTTLGKEACPVLPVGDDKGYALTTAMEHPPVPMDRLNTFGDVSNDARLGAVATDAQRVVPGSSDNVTIAEIEAQQS